MNTIISAILRWAAGNLLPAAWIKATITGVLNALLTRLFQYADRIAKNTLITDLDDRAVAALREKIMAHGVVSDFVDYVYSLLFGTSPPAPVDPINPPEPLPPEPARPGVLKRLTTWFRARVANNW